MTEPHSDPRVYFAAERTMLAWLRTGITIMAFGFVVARFGLFLRLILAQTGEVPGRGLSPFVGAALVVLGVVATAGGAVQFQRFCRTLTPAERPPNARPGFTLGISWTLVVVGIAMVLMLSV